MTISFDFISRILYLLVVVAIWVMTIVYLLKGRLERWQRILHVIFVIALPLLVYSEIINPDARWPMVIGVFLMIVAFCIYMVDHFQRRRNPSPKWQHPRGKGR